MGSFWCIFSFASITNNYSLMTNTELKYVLTQNWTTTTEDCIIQTNSSPIITWENDELNINLEIRSNIIARELPETPDYVYFTRIGYYCQFIFKDHYDFFMVPLINATANYNQTIDSFLEMKQICR
jgi:hypothetical protein